MARPTFTMHCSDVIKWAAAYRGPKFHALLGDPPYHLTDPRDPRRASPSAAQRRNRAKSKGFMGKRWDGGDLAFNPETWAAFGAHLFPGAFGMAFASSRGWHRLAVAIEDAGFIIHPSIFGWLFASGFPKATRIDTAIDEGGEWRANPLAEPTPHSGKVQQVKTSTHRVGEPKATYEAATPLARAWAGHRYGLQAMKPALEPVIVFQKPYEGRPVDCITETGAGAINIDGARLPTKGKKWSEPRGGIWQTDSASSGELVDNPQGRWPANFYLGDEEAAARLDEQSGELTSGVGAVKRQTADGWQGNAYGKESRPAGTPNIEYGDSGPASRFFFNVREQLDAADPVLYMPKASRAERDAGLYGVVEHENISIELFQAKNGGSEWEDEGRIVRLRVDTAQSPPRVIEESTTRSEDASLWNMLLFGSEKEGRSPLASKSITLMKISSITESKTLSYAMRSLTNAYTADASCETANGGNLAESAEPSSPSSLSFINGETVSLPGVGNVASGTLWRISASEGPLNSHSTVKPIDLCRWLATLLLPPAEYAPRRILIPFAGVGSECIGAMQAGWDDIAGIEGEQDHCTIAEARFEYWAQREGKREPTAEVLKPRKGTDNYSDLPLFAKGD